MKNPGYVFKTRKFKTGSIVLELKKSKTQGMVVFLPPAEGFRFETEEDGEDVHVTLVNLGDGKRTRLAVFSTQKDAEEAIMLIYKRLFNPLLRRMFKWGVTAIAGMFLGLSAYIILMPLFETIKVSDENFMKQIEQAKDMKVQEQVAEQLRIMQEQLAAKQAASQPQPEPTAPAKSVEDVNDILKSSK
jgi:multidrug efflux pump subunit AcrB